MKKTPKKKYKFDKNGHYHSLDGEPLFGVTTVLGVIAKPFLIPWASKMCAEHVRSNWKIGKAYTKKEREEILKEAQNAHQQAKSSAGGTGTNVHEAIEKWIKKGKVLKTKDEQVQKMFDNFVEWATDNDVKFLESEQHVHSEIHWYAGIIDFICTINGKTFVGDIKTSSGIYPEHFFQMGAYDICKREMNPEFVADGYIIVNVQKNGEIRVMQFFETLKFREAFLHALELHKALKTMVWNKYY